jgi:hypothetical protein
MLLLFDALVLWIHLFSAVIFVRGSFFMWLVIVPASRLITHDEPERTGMVGNIAKRFGNLTNYCRDPRALRQVRKQTVRIPLRPTVRTIFTRKTT